MEKSSDRQLLIDADRAIAWLITAVSAGDWIDWKDAIGKARQVQRKIQQVVLAERYGVVFGLEEMIEDDDNQDRG